jgi:uncharacterized protein (DUF488 family)
LNEYLEGTNWLAKFQENRRVAIMCSEAKWFSCHRGMVADSMWHIHGIDTHHIPVGSKTHSEVLTDRLERYHSAFMHIWDEYKISIG